MNQFAGSVVVVVALVAIVQSAAATDPYPLDEVTEITARWAHAAAGVTTVHADIRKVQYDWVYRTVTEWEGTVDFERPNRCRLELRPVAAALLKPVKFGNRELEPADGDGRIWLWTDDEVTVFSPKHDGFESYALKAGTTSQNFPWTLPSHHLGLTFTLSDPTTVAELGYQLVRQPSFPAGLTAIPVSQTAKREIHHINFRFNPDTGLPCAARALNPHETSTTVLYLSNVELNPKNDSSSLFERPAHWKRLE